MAKVFFLQNPKYYIPLERYFCDFKKIIPSKFIANLRPHDDVIKNFRKILLLMMLENIYHWKDIKSYQIYHIKRYIISKDIISKDIISTSYQKNYSIKSFSHFKATRWHYHYFRKKLFFKNITIGNALIFFSYIILSNCFSVWYNVLCEEQFVSEMSYVDDSFIISFLNMLFLYWHNNFSSVLCIWSRTNYK